LHLNPVLAEFRSGSFNREMRWSGLVCVGQLVRTHTQIKKETPTDGSNSDARTTDTTHTQNNEMTTDEGSNYDGRKGTRRRNDH
jgi:hypothetical protein